MTTVPPDSEVVKRLTIRLAAAPLPIGDLMRQAQQGLVGLLDRALSNEGWSDVRAAHVSALAGIHPDGSRLTDLVGRGGRTKQATAELLTHLARHGYVTLEPDPADRRAKRYIFTQRGLTLLVAGAAVVDDYERWLDDAIGPDGVGRLRSMLEAIVESTNEHRPRTGRTSPIRPR